jgi:hypothetical protein
LRLALEEKCRIWCRRRGGAATPANTASKAGREPGGEPATPGPDATLLEWTLFRSKVIVGQTADRADDEWSAGPRTARSRACRRSKTCGGDPVRSWRYLRPDPVHPDPVPADHGYPIYGLYREVDVELGPSSSTSRSRTDQPAPARCVRPARGDGRQYVSMAVHHEVPTPPRSWPRRTRSSRRAGAAAGERSATACSDRRGTDRCRGAEIVYRSG